MHLTQSHAMSKHTLAPALCSSPTKAMHAVIGLLLAASAMASVAQQTTTTPRPTTGTAPNGTPAVAMPAIPENSPQAAAIKSAISKLQSEGAARAVLQGLASGGLPGVRDGLVTEVGSGRPVGEGARVLSLPGQCTPKTNQLDCVEQTRTGAGGADVSGRVRKGVIGEVGVGRAATEGAGSVQGSSTCTPAPGKLTCEP
jgi:hypothetical protein